MNQTFATTPTAVLPHELALSILDQMEPGEIGFCHISAIEVDRRGGVWVDVGCNVKPAPDAEFSYDVEVRREEAGFRLRIPASYRIPRQLQFRCPMVCRVLSVEVVSEVLDVR